MSHRHLTAALLAVILLAVGALIIGSTTSGNAATTTASAKPKPSMPRSQRHTIDRINRITDCNDLLYEYTTVSRNYRRSLGTPHSKIALSYVDAVYHRMEVDC